MPWSRETTTNWDGVLSTLKAKFANAIGADGRKSARDYKDVIAELTTGIEKSILTKDTFLVRGSDANGFAGLAQSLGDFNKIARMVNSGDVNGLNALLKNQRIVNHAFTSTGIVEGTGFGGNVAYRIYAPKGTKAVYAEPASYFGNTISGEQIYKAGQKYYGVGGEAEIILQRGTEFRVTNITKRGSGNDILVEMEIVNQPNYFKTGYEHTHNNGMTFEK